MKQGTLRTLAGYGGRPGGAAAAASAWEYSMAMHSAQFAPAPAGICAEQFRIWEALEAGCIPILLERHMAPGSVLYPIRFLRFEVVQLGSWQEVPEKLLQLGDQMAHNPQIWTRRQQHNSKLWAHVKGGVATRIAQSVCEIGRPSTTQ
ncbi:hypothetical protein COCSUDRAFT_38668 [Coccomyxa subellipsoidea C-169]|uniref:RXYLT1 C-terminal domain-containing protein n=1 Tax=Coccomyxa subellipsoidea (strain C-169) TaxID=574566 RepID=I0YJ44_COCSC|nr:hypothetical protein COCSUDRAFT_38668 [Coccomyxa subellipsoidea C-169]EIE18413.1 hypothetical protein COCSUDRAFT_38668 [Coccomyxa subellipsoidea C-169]|eukprot:XP_005642957.1 hypothetical protein COCSUDRAFT_38668 [Coccomyxa subellipsoidea C-169]